MAQIGIGMVPRGEVGIVAAQIGLGLGVKPIFFCHDFFYGGCDHADRSAVYKYIVCRDNDKDGVPDQFIEQDISEKYTRIG